MDGISSKCMILTYKNTVFLIIFSLIVILSHEILKMSILVLIISEVTVTKDINNRYRKKIKRQRRHRRMQLFESAVGAIVAVIFVCALGQGNLRKNVSGQEMDRPEGGTSAQISESVTEDVSSDTDAAMKASMQPQSGKDMDASKYVADDSYFSSSLLIGDSRAETLGLYSDMPSWNVCASKNLDVESVSTLKMVDCGAGQKCTVLEMLQDHSYSTIYISFGIEELNWYNARYINAYRALLDNITKLQPNAKVYVMSTIPVSAELSAKDGVYNNPGIDRLNLLVSELCGAYDNVTYLDVASEVAKDGVLPDGVSIDGIHYNKEFSQKIIDYIKTNIDVE